MHEGLRGPRGQPGHGFNYEAGPSACNTKTHHTTMTIPSWDDVLYPSGWPYPVQVEAFGTAKDEYCDLDIQVGPLGENASETGDDHPRFRVLFTRRSESTSLGPTALSVSVWDQLKHESPIFEHEVRI